jgi:hypothetical protein
MPTQPPTQWVPAFFPGDKAAGREVGHSPESPAEVKNEWRYTSIFPICLHGVEKGNYKFLPLFIYLFIYSFIYL